MNSEEKYAAIIERLLNSSELAEAERRELEQALDEPAARAMFDHAKAVHELLRRDAQRIALTSDELEEMKLRLRTVIEEKMADFASAATEKSDIMGNADDSLLTWLRKLTDRVTAVAQASRVFALGSLGGEEGGQVFEVPLEHPEIEGALSVRRRDAVHLEIYVSTVSGGDPGLAVSLKDGTKFALRVNTANKVNMDKLPGKGLAPPRIEFTLQEDVSE